MVLEQLWRRKRMRRLLLGWILPALTVSMAVVYAGTAPVSGAPNQATQRATVYHPFLTLAPYTVRPGSNVHIIGHAFVAHSVVTVTLPIARTDQRNETLTRNAATDTRGNFSMFLLLPADTRAGRYRIDALGHSGNWRASTFVTVSVHPTVKVEPSSVLPGQSVTVSGTNFESGARIAVTATFTLPGGSRTVAAVTRSGNAGSYSVRLSVPARTVLGNYRIYARTFNSAASTLLLVRGQPVKPTATPRPTSVSATSTPLPAPTAIIRHRHRKFGFRYISIWYHAVRVGTANHLVVQARRRTTQAIWVHVWFPAGPPQAYYENTNRHGHWEKDIPIPSNTLRNGNNHVLVTFRLWHGRQSRERFSGFTLLP
jgi:hypothetical protein